MKSKVNTIQDLFKYVDAFRYHLGYRVYIVFSLTVFVTIIEAIGIMLFIPIIINFNKESLHNIRDDTGILNNYALSTMEFMGLPESIAGMIALTMLVFIFKGIIVLSVLSYNVHLKATLLEHLKVTLFDYYLKMDYRYYTNKDTGNLINIVNEQVNRSMLSFSFLTQLGSQIIGSITYIAISFFISWEFGFLALIMSIFVIFIFKGLSAAVRDYSRHHAKENGKLARLIIDFLYSFKYFTATNSFNNLKDRVDQSIQSLCFYERRIGILNAVVQAAREPVGVVIIMLIIYLEVAYFGRDISIIMVSILLFYRGINSVFSVQANWQRTLEYVGSMELVDIEMQSIKDNLENNGRECASRLNKAIELKDVSFSYNRGVSFIKNINISIKSNEMIALVGESGSGKTTIVDLILMILKPSSGKVVIDGISGHEINLPTWRKQIGYVSQDGVVFNNTIYNNIAGIDADIRDEKTRDNVLDAAKQADLLSFIEGLPQGFETSVGERGVKMSGGQRQRLFIARELYKKPSLLILDEATSALDSSSEQSVTSSIKNLKGRVTIIIIAHRLSTIKDVDRVLVMKSGEVIEQGEYNSLLKRKESVFYNMVKLQNIQ